MIVTTSALYKLAYSRYAIGAYNINNLEQTLGLFKGCIESQAPFIIQLSKGSRKYAVKRMLADGRLVWTRVHREFFRDHPDEFDFRPPGKIFVEEYGKFIANKNGHLGSA